MNRNLLLLFFSLCSFFTYAQLNMSFVGQIDYDQDLSDCWGYAAPDGTEYALVGLRNGVSIVSLADPANPVEVDFVPGANSGWRDIMTWGEHAYVTNETGNGVAVIDLSPLPDSVNAFDWQPNISGLGTINSCHNLWIDEGGFLYLCGCNVNNGGLLFVDVATNPGIPIYLGANAPVYSHDVFVRDSIAYSAEIEVGAFSIYDVKDKNNPMVLASQETPSLTTHNVWLSDDSNILFSTDETGNAPVTSFDVSDFTDIRELDQFVPLETLGTGVVPHNVHTWQDFLIISYYTDGCILVDGSRPENLIEVGNFDTFIPSGSGFIGAWGAYPYLPSGLVLVSDIGDGLFILEPNYVRACYLEGAVTDAVSGLGIFGASVDILTDNAISSSDLLGDYATGTAIPGSYSVEVKKPGYESKVVADVMLENGIVTDLDVELDPLPSFSYTGKVIDAVDGLPVENAKVLIANSDFEYELTTDAAGNFEIGTFYNGDYEIIAGKWGFKTTFMNATGIDENNNTVIVELEAGIEDVFSLDLGWEITGSAFQGQFELGDPIGLNPPEVGGIFIQPEDDVAEDQGNSCYYTGNVADLQGGIQIAGTTIATSPIFDMSTMNDPRVSFYTRLFTANISNNIPTVGNDPLVVKISNGIETKQVATIVHESLFEAPEWTYMEVIVGDTITPTANMQIIFEIGDLDPNFQDVAEAGFDYFQAYDADPINSTNEIIMEGLQLSVAPNPSSNQFYVDYQIDASLDNGTLEIYNLLGQSLEQIPLDQASGRKTVGADLRPGIYFIRMSGHDFSSKAIRLIKR